jgi:hypothetical protein
MIDPGEVWIPVRVAAKRIHRQENSILIIRNTVLIIRTNKFEGAPVSRVTGQAGFGGDRGAPIA